MAPSSPTAGRSASSHWRATSARSSAAACGRELPPRDPAVEERREVERVLASGCRSEPMNIPPRCTIAAEHARARAAGGADHARLEQPGASRVQPAAARALGSSHAARGEPAAEQRRRAGLADGAPAAARARAASSPWQRAEPVAEQQRPAKDRPRDGCQVLVAHTGAVRRRAVLQARDRPGDRRLPWWRIVTAGLWTTFQPACRTRRQKSTSSE